MGTNSKDTVMSTAMGQGRRSSQALYAWMLTLQSWVTWDKSLFGLKPHTFVTSSFLWWCIQAWFSISYRLCQRGCSHSRGLDRGRFAPMLTLLVLGRICFFWLLLDWGSPSLLCDCFVGLSKGQLIVWQLASTEKASRRATDNEPDRSWSLGKLSLRSANPSFYFLLVYNAIL